MHNITSNLKSLRTAIYSADFIDTRQRDRYRKQVEQNKNSILVRFGNAALFKEVGIAWLSFDNSSHMQPSDIVSFKASLFKALPNA
jgi:hypothetical protein